MNIKLGFCLFHLYLNLRLNTYKKKEIKSGFFNLFIKE